VVAEFGKTKASHPSAHFIPRNWPSASDLESIVQKSSRQFIYAATVMRYISRPSTVPSLGLERVKGIIPIAENSPCTHLDSIYIFILSQADYPEATRDMLSMYFLHQTLNLGVSLKWLLRHYNAHYDHDLVESCVSELSAIVRLNSGGNLEFYHASLADFLVDQARSGIYCVNLDAFKAKVLVAFWENPDVSIGMIYPTPTSTILYLTCQ
jgi:hypothetical protein